MTYRIFMVPRAGVENPRWVGVSGKSGGISRGAIAGAGYLCGLFSHADGINQSSASAQPPASALPAALPATAAPLPDPFAPAAGAAGAGGRLCVAGSWGQQRTVGINLPPQQHYFCVSPDKIA